MSTTKDWRPGTREGQLAMARDWKTVTAARQSDWDIPAATLTGFDSLIQAAETALGAAQNRPPAPRWPPPNVRKPSTGWWKKCGT
jgi:hypothetical protein